MRCLSLVLMLVAALSITAQSEQILSFPFDHDETVDCGWGCYTTPFFHSGLDYRFSSGGEPVYAAIGGTVHIVEDVTGQTCTASLGNYVEITQGDYKVYHAHLQYGSICVTEDETVVAGELIGLVGNTGYTLTLVDGEWECQQGGGDHLHLEVKVNNSGTWTSVNPDTYDDGLWIDPRVYGGQAFIATQTGYSIDPSEGPYTPGQTIECDVYWLNDGTATWSNQSGSDYVELASCNYSGTIVPSYLYASGLGWTSNQVPCTFNPGTPTTIAPSATATFHFHGKIPSNAQPGQVPIYFGPVFSGQIMDNWDGNGFTIQVAEPTLSGTDFVAFAGKFNTDQYCDVGLWNRSTGDIYIALRDPNSNKFIWDDDPWLCGWKSGTGYQLLVGDYSGDGYDDLCMYYASSGSWYVALNQYGSTGGFVSDGCWLSGWASGGIGGSSDWMPLTADYDGSGKDDICVYKPSLGRWVVAYNYSGDYFAQAGGIWLDDWGDGSYGTYWPFTGTLNNNTKQDIGCYHPATGKWFVATSNSPTTTFTSQGEWLDAWASGTSTEWRYFLGKCSNDNLDDIIVYRPSDGKWVVAKNYTTYFEQLNGAGTGGAWLNGWATEDGDEWQALVGNVSDDAWTDLIVYTPVTGSWNVAYNDGGINPPYFAQEDGVDDGDSWLTNWGVICGSPKLYPGGETTRPSEFSLSHNYPNPFNPTTTISYALPEPSNVKIDIYNILGQNVTTLVDELQEPGEHQVTWNAGDQPTGIYFYRIATDDNAESKKMLLIK